MASGCSEAFAPDLQVDENRPATTAEAVGERTEARARPAPRRPNILLIVTDDQRGGLSVMPRTRSLFIKRGVNFKNAFVTMA